MLATAAAAAETPTDRSGELPRGTAAEVAASCRQLDADLAHARPCWPRAPGRLLTGLRESERDSLTHSRHGALRPNGGGEDLDA